MKKLNLWKLLFSALTVLAATTFSACVDDNEDNGMPYLEVSPSSLSFDANADPAVTNVITVVTNRPWELSIEQGGDWVTAQPDKGQGNAKVEIVVPPSNSGRSTTLTFSLKNTYGTYLSKTVTVEQGTIGPVSRLVSYIKKTWPNLSTDSQNEDVELNYSESEIEAVILANNAGGNNGSKLYVGDNINQGNSAIILFGSAFNTVANYPVGSRVKLDLSKAKYSLFYGLRELKDVEVTVLEKTETLVVPKLTVDQFNTNNYQGQYVEIQDVTPESNFVGKPWAGESNQTLTFTSGNATLAVRMSAASYATGFKNLTLVQHTGSIRGAAEQNRSTSQLMPTRSADITGFFDALPTVTTGEATVVSATSVTLTGSLVFVTDPTKVGFQYIPYAEEPDWSAATDVEATLSDDTWTQTIDGLTQGQKYSYRAYATNATDTYYGEPKSFTPDVAADVTVDFSTATYPEGFPTSSTSEGVTEGKVWQFNGYDYGFYPSSGNKYYRTGTTAILIGKSGAYITLPAIEGKSLAKVRCMANSTGTLSTNVEVGIYTAAEAAVQGGEAQKWDQGNSATYEYVLAGTSVNTSYRIEITNAYNVQIQKIELWYNDGGTPGKPTITVDPDALTFTAAADATGKEVAVTVENEGAMSVFMVNTDNTHFPATYDATTDKLTVTALENTSETESKTATITLYLAEAEGGAHAAEAVVTVTQASKKPKTVADLNAYIAELNPAVDAEAELTEFVGQNVIGYIAANASSNNLYQMISVVDNTGAAGSGILLFDKTFATNPEANYPIGKKVTIPITGDSKVKNSKGLIELINVIPEVDKEGASVQITVPAITVAELNAQNYMGMPVKVTGLKFDGTEYEQWSTSSTTTRDFISGSDKVGVATYVTSAWAKDYISLAQTNGAVIGIVQTNKTVYPQSSADVADFDVTEPAIVAYSPRTVELSGAGGSEQVRLTILNRGSNTVTATGAPAGVTVSFSDDYQTVTLTVGPNSGDATTPQDLTLTLSNGNTVKIPVSQMAAGLFMVIVDQDTEFTPALPSANAAEATYAANGYDWVAANVKQNAGYWMVNKTSGYFGTPAIADASLQKILITTSNGISASAAVDILEGSSAGTKILSQALGNKNETYTIELPAPSVNTSYYIKATSKANVQIVKFELIYKK